MTIPAPERLAMWIRAHPYASLAIALVLLSTGLLSAADAYATPVRERVVERHERWSEAAIYTYSVPITRNETIWPIGAVLPMGEPAYYRTVTDRIPVNFTWRPSEGVTGAAEAEMVVRVRAEAKGQEKPFWEFNHRLASASVDDASEGLALSGTLWLDALVEEYRVVVRDLPPDKGNINWSVETRVTYALTSRERSEAGTSTYLLPIDVADPRIVLPGADALTWTRSHADLVTHTLEHKAGWTGVLESARTQALALAGLGGVAVVLALRWNDPWRGLDPATVAYRRERERLAEWVTASPTPVDSRALARPVVEVDSLQALVETAADGRVRVLLDETRRIYYALLPGITYRYARHALMAAAHAEGEAFQTPHRRLPLVRARR